MALLVLDKLTAGQMSASNDNLCPSAPAACPPTVPGETAGSFGARSAAAMVIGFSWVPSMLQMTLGFHGQWNRSRKEHMFGWG